MKNLANNNTMHLKEFGKGMQQHDILNRCQFYVNIIVEAEVKIIQANKK